MQLDTADPKSYILAHDKRVVLLDRKPLDYLRNLYRANNRALGQELVYGGPVDRDEFVSAIIDQEFPEIREAREAYVASVVV
jgi:hypothetical protein